MHAKVITDKRKPHMTVFGKFHKQKSNPFAVRVLTSFIDSFPLVFYVRFKSLQGI